MVSLGERHGASERARQLGSAAWLLCLQFFLAEQIAIVFWRGEYSMSGNFISDLGVGCRLDATEGCAGWPALMNTSFMLQAGLIGAGAVLLGRGVRPLALRLGFIFAGLSAPGLLLVGLFPEDAYPSVHHDAAALHFLALSLSGFCFALSLAQRPKAQMFAALSLTAALTGMIGTALLALQMDFGFGLGTVERLVAYPFSIWLAGLGLGYQFGRIEAWDTFASQET